MREIRRKIAMRLFHIWGSHCARHCMDADPRVPPHTVSEKAGCWYEVALWYMVNHIHPLKGL